MQIHISNSPRHLLLTPTMIEDFLWDPILAYRVIWPGLQLDAFQKVASKIDWWVPNVMDSSGINSGKSFRRFFTVCLRALLIPHFSGRHVSTVYFPSLGSTKKNFWKYFQNRIVRSQIFNANIGQIDAEDDAEKKPRKGIVKDPDCLYCKLRSGAQIEGPAPDIKGEAAGQKSARQNTQLYDEWIVFDEAGTVIDDELVKRNTGENFSPFHPLWGNHSMFSAHAETSIHPGHARYRRFMREIERGNPNYAHLNFSYKDYSDLARGNGMTFRNLRDSAENAMGLSNSGQTNAKKLGTNLGFWGQSGDGFYTEEMIGAAQRLGVHHGLLPVTSRAMWEGLRRSAERGARSAE